LKNYTIQKGSSTLEILIAFAILILAISVTIIVAFGNQSNSVDAQTNSEALYKAQKLLEEARALSRQNFDSVVSIAPISDGIYQKSLFIDSIDDSTKAATSTISWASGERNLSVSLDTVFTGPPSSNTCSPMLVGDWTAPKHYDFAISKLMPTNNSNGIGISDLKAYHQKLYVVAKTPANSNDTFYIFDLPTNPISPPIYDGSIDNSATVSVGLSALAVFGNYAYVANSYTGSASGCIEGANCAQLQIINISNPLNPFVVRNLKIPAITSGGKLAAGTSIFYSRGYIYLGLAKASGSGLEFNIIDVGGGGTGGMASILFL
jgi:Tfp pilus assembly protein PilV